MLKDEIIKTWDFLALVKECESDKLSKSLLFISKDNLYSFEFCKAIACLIFDGEFDEKSENNLKVYANSHPDLKVFPLKDKLVVADAQEIVAESFIKPIFAEKKVFIIKNIDEAMEVAQNKLLKILEEPPKNVYFLLTCNNLNKVLPTIRSRCNKTELKRLDDEIIKKLIHGAGEEEENLAVAVGDGQIGKALDLCKKKDFVSLCKDAASVLTKMKTSKEVLIFSKKLQNYKDEYLLILEIISIAISDLLKIKAGKNDLRLTGFEHEFEPVASEYTVRALCEISFLIDNVVKEKFYNVNSTLSLENFLLNILEVKYLCK